MTIACTLAASATPSTASNLTISYSGVTTNSYLVCASNAGATGTFSAVTDDGGNTWTQLLDCPATGSVGRRDDMWICAKPTSNFTTITVTHNHVSQAQASLVEITGANQSSFADQSAALEHAASATPAAVSITPSASGTLAIATIQANSNNHSTAVTVPSGWTDLAGYNTAGPKIVYQVNPTSGVALSPAFVLTVSQGSGSNTANFFGAPTPTPISDSDTGTFVDAGESIAGAVSDSDVGSGVEAASIVANLSDSDSGSAVESQSVATPLGQPWLDSYVAGYSFAVLLGFGVDTTTAVNTWVLTDVTADVLQADGTQGIVITRGRLDEFSQTSPASAVFTLKNGADGGNGRYSFRRPQSDLWPYVREGVPCQVLIIHSATRYEQFAGFVDEFAPEFDETGSYSVVHVTAHGSLQPLQNTQKPLRSALLRTISTVPVAPYAYFPMEDGSTATNFASAIAGVAALVAVGSVSIGSTGGPGTAASGDFSGGGYAIASVRVPAGTPVWRVAFAFSPTSATQSFVPIHINTNTGTIWELEFDTTSTNVTLGVGSQQPGGVSSTWQTFAGVPWAVDSWHSIVLDALDTGSDMGYVLAVDGVVQSNHHAFLSQQLGAITSLVLSPQPPTFSTSTSNSFRIAHLAVWSSNPSDDLSSPCAGWAGETAVNRMVRLCAENNIPFAADGTSNKPMGPQGVASLASLLRECEDVDGGVLEDGVGFGCFMHTAGARANQSATMALALTDLVPVFQPIENNAKVMNDAVVSRPDGASAEYIQPTGQPYAPTGIGGVGYIEKPFTLNLQDDTQLLNRASWYVHQGTVDEDRYSSLTFNLARTTAQLPSWLACLLGSRVTVSGNYSTGGIAGADVLLEGWTFTLSRLLATVTANCSPSVAWRVAVVDDASLGRVSGAGSTLHAGINAVVTTFVMDTITPWTTTALSPSAFPADYDLDGEQITVGACTGSGGSYTFSSVTRSVNGMVKTHSTGAPIKIWRPGVVSL